MPTRDYLKAPKDKFRVIGVDTFSNEDWEQGVFDTIDEAKKVAKDKGGIMTKMYVYDDNGNCLYDAGTY